MYFSLFSPLCILTPILEICIAVALVIAACFSLGSEHYKHGGDIATIVVLLASLISDVRFGHQHHQHFLRFKETRPQAQTQITSTSSSTTTTTGKQLNTSQEMEEGRGVAEIEVVSPTQKLSEGKGKKKK